MGMNAAIDVAIALILMYLILSLIVTVANEQIATALDLRAETLKSALSDLLDDKRLKDDFDSHGLIAGLNAAVSPDKASVFFRMIAWLCAKIMRFQRSMDTSHISYLSGKTFALAVLGSLDPTKPVPLFDDVREAVQHMPDTNVRDALLAQITVANGDLDKLRDNISTWFDSAMDRVSGVYKRDVKRISFTVGLLLAVVVNGDTFRVSQALWNDASLRSGIADSASAVIAKKAEAQPDNVKSDSVKDALDKIKGWQDELRPLPLGWNADPLTDKFSVSFDFALALFVKLGGLLLTGFAISLGAPFWFDLLGRFVQIRGTGKKPEKTQQT
jgi:hypothetical protein